MSAFFRRASKSTVGTVLMVLFVLAIAASFALADVQSYISGGIGQTGTLAKVGDEAVTERELGTAMQRRLAEVRQQDPTADYPSLANDFGRILESLVQDRALQVFARKTDLHLSKRLVDGEIVKIPGTRGLDGKFSDVAYQAFLQEERLTDADLRALLSGALTTRLLLAPAAANARIPVGVATPYASMLLEQREAEVAIVPAQLFAAGVPQPSDGDLQAFYRQNGARYMVPEQRVLSIAQIGPGQVASVAASEQEIAAFYRANQAEYGGKSTRVLSQAIAQSESQGRALAQTARSGSSPGTSLGEKTREELAGIAGEAIAAAAFGARQGDVVGPIRSDLGWHVIKVDRVRNQTGRPLSAVSGEIAARLNADKRKEALEALVDKVQTAIDDGASMAEAARTAGLAVTRTPPVTAGGVSRAQPGFKLSDQLAPALAAGFDLGEGEEPVIESLPGDAGYALVGVDDVIAAAPAPLASIRDQVAADWRTKQARDRARSAASEIAAKVARGTPMAQAVAGSGNRIPAPQTLSKRRLELSAAGGNVPPALGMMFSLAQGRSRMVADPQGLGFIVVKVTKIVPGNANLQPALVSRTQSEFQQMAGTEYAEQMARAIQADVGVKRDDAAIAAAKRRITGGGN
jgi:peptidyl-prolyl cis-trans isomerase D